MNDVTLQTPPRNGLAHDGSTAGDLLRELLVRCVSTDASDLHIAPELPPFLRIHGILEPQGDVGPLPAETTAAMGEVLAHGFDRGALDTTGSFDGAMTAADGTRFRFNVFKRQSAISIALRRLEDRFRTLADL